MKDCCSFPLSVSGPTIYIFSLFYVFSLTLNGLFCRMDDAEACFILSSRNEVDRMAAVRKLLTQIIYSVAQSKCKKATVFIRTIRQSWEPGQWRTLPQTAPFMSRYSNRRISSMSNLQVSLFRQILIFIFQSNTFAVLHIWYMVPFSILSRSCCVWGGVQVRHVGSKLHLSRHLHPDHAPCTHLQRTVSHPTGPPTFPGSFVRLQRSNLFRLSRLMMWNMTFTEQKGERAQAKMKSQFIVGNGGKPREHNVPAKRTGGAKMAYFRTLFFLWSHMKSYLMGNDFSQRV